MAVMGFVPDPAPAPDATPPAAQEGFVPDKSSFLSDKAKNIPFAQNAAGMAKEVGRVVAKAGIYAATIGPDIATSLVNAVANKGEKLLGVPHGEDAPMPSSYLIHQLDKVSTPPESTSGKQGEELAATVLSGTKGASKLGFNVIEDLAKAGLRQGGKLVGHVVDRGLTRVTMAAAEQAHNADIALSPSYVGGKVSKAIQQAAGGGKVDKVISEQNIPKIDKLAKTSLGLHPDEQLDDYTFSLLEKENYAKYDRLAGIGKLPPDPLYDASLKAAGGRFAERSSGFGGGSRFESVGQEKAHYLAASANEVSAQEAIDEVRALRQNARGNLKTYDPEKNALGQVQRQIADAIDARLERRASALAKPGQGLVPQGAAAAQTAPVLPPNVYQEYKNARQNLAKIATVRDSLGPDGHVVASSLAAAQDAGVKLTDGLKVIADTAKHFPRSVQYVGKTGEQGIWSPLDFLVGGAGLLTHNPKAALVSVARPVARAALGTKTAQAAMLGKSTRLGNVGKTVVRGAITRGSEAAQEDDDQ
jgi:hypothetical protein